MGNWLDAWLVAVRQAPGAFDRPAVRRVALIFASGLFFGGILISLRARPGLLENVEPLVLLAVFALVPLTIAANTAQFWLTARLLDAPLRFTRAFSITVLSTAANLLPLPGGAAVRIAALKKSGEGYLRPTGLTLLVALFWLGLSSLIASVALASLGHLRLAAVASVVSVTVLPIVGHRLVTKYRADAKWIAALASTQLGLAAIGSLRLWLCFQALSDPIFFQHAFVLMFSSIVGAFVGVAPGGLGVTELTAAAIAGVIGISAGTAFVAAAVNRLTGLIVVAPLASALGFARAPISLISVRHQKDSEA